MNKRESYAIKGAIGLGVIAVVKNIIDQVNLKKPGGKIDWWQVTRHFVVGGAIGGAGGHLLGVYRDNQNAKEIPLNTDALMAAFVVRVRLRKDNPLYVALDGKAQYIAAKLNERFKAEISTPVYKYGSTESETALKEKADIDMCMECRSGSFNSTESMYFSVEDYLRSLCGKNGIVKIRSQRVSLGVYVLINAQQRKIDITPKKLTSSTRKDTSGYLYLNRNGVFETPGRTKTDVTVLKDLRLTETQKRLLIVLKSLKQDIELPISSSLLQILIRYCYEAYRGEIPKTFTKKVILVLQYIADNIEHIVIRSPENTNNILTDSMSASDKASLRRSFQRIIDDYRYQPNSVIHHFHL